MCAGHSVLYNKLHTVTTKLIQQINKYTSKIIIHYTKQANTNMQHNFCTAL